MTDTQKLNYVMSGSSYSRMHSAIDRPELVSVLDSIIAKVHKETNHHFSILYNSFTEHQYGKNLKHFKECYEIHSDSGGLQIITQGKKITPDLMDGIFKNQAKYSDLAMCFDMIPIRTTGETSGRNDVSNRFFDISGLEPAARETGRNIRRQIEVFLEAKSAAKPILIAQGNCYETYMKWTDYIMEEIPKDMHQYIGGVAMGGAALGTGSMEDIERAFIFTQLQVEKKHLHILGVGSIKRLVPYLIFIQNGMYEGVSVSYDSTTHSSGIELGNYYHGGAMQSFTRHFSKTYNLMFEDVKRLSNIDMDINEYFKVINTGRTSYIKSGGTDEDFLVARFSSIIGSIINFCKNVDSISESKNSLVKFISKTKEIQNLGSLFDVTDVNKYNEWKATVGRYVKTNRISSSQPASLEDMFQ